MSRYVKDSNGNWQLSAGLPQVDNELDSTSENPIQNKVVSEEIDNIWESQNILGAKNLLPNNAPSSYVDNGITFTKSADGSFTTTAGTTSSVISEYKFVEGLILPKGEYIFSGFPDSSGTDSSKVFMEVKESWGGLQICKISASDLTKKFTVSSDSYPLYVRIYIASGVVLPAMTFKPMIRPASIADDTYVPYAMTNRELTTETANKLNNNRDGYMQGTLTAYQFMLGNTYNCSVINIDTINNTHGYIMRFVLGGADNLGTLPTSIIGGNAFLLIGFSQCHSNGSVIYGVQIAIGFGASKIAIRNASYNSSGGSWSAWTAV